MANLFVLNERVARQSSLPLLFLPPPSRPLLLRNLTLTALYPFLPPSSVLPYRHPPISTVLGRWKHGFFGMVPVGATNVGSIRINFDESLRTNNRLRPHAAGTYIEAVYSKASKLLRGQPLNPGDEMGGFMLGSTIVLIFEAPLDFAFSVQEGQKIKVGEPIGESLCVCVDRFRPQTER